VSRKIFVNLPVADLKRSTEFFGKLGFSFNPQFTDETAACMNLGEGGCAMLLTHAKFKQFSPLPIADATKATEVLICLTCDDRAEVDATVAKAVAAGGRTFKPATDLGFMYGRSFQDLDGHVWEWVWMHPDAVKEE
jgi:predicted lactoylglutathione lyase